ncbi:hypothetical protein GCM10009127_22210 [Alteraurantiacibacter aestuarii]|uniref:hypothetical protein n=1 Tax=Alteraurantiacibacter aestuarii TaxID=650004 RepID=UPI0031D39E1F
MDRNFQIADIFSGVSALLSKASREVMIYILVLGALAILGLVMGYTNSESFSLEAGFMIDENDTPMSGLFELVSAIVSVVAAYLLAKAYLAGSGHLRTTENRFWPYLGMGILSVLGIVFGFVLLIVPGIFLLVRWSAATGYLVGAGKGVTESLSDSWDATKGHGWTIFFAGLILMISLVIVGGIIGAVLGVAGDALSSYLLAFVEAAAGAISIAFGISVYTLVSNDAGDVSEVFS